MYILLLQGVSACSIKPFVGVILQVIANVLKHIRSGLAMKDFILCFDWVVVPLWVFLCSMD